MASSRRIAQRLHEDIAFRVLAANNTPDFPTISDSRKDHLEAMSGLFQQVLALCHQTGLVKLGHVSLDGTKVRANASKHKAMSYGQMKQTEPQLETEVAELLRRAQEVDHYEDRWCGNNQRGDELPKDAYPPISRPGIGCVASCVPSGGDSVTRFAWKRWSRVRTDQSTAGASGNS